MINKNLFKKAIASALCLATCLSVSVATSADTDYNYIRNIINDGSGDSTIIEVTDCDTFESRFRACGRNDSGQLGIGNFVAQSTPVNIAGIDGASKIVPGNQCFYALIGTTLKVWGDNTSYQLGFNSGDICTPTTLLTGVEDVVAGAYYAYAVMTDGTVKGWGINDYGQLGLGNTTTQITPVTIANLINVETIYSSYCSKHAMALLSDGSLKAWGKNDYGQLGIGNTVNQTIPVSVTGLLSSYDQLDDIKMSPCSTYFTTSNEGGASLKSCGKNTSGQLGIGTTTNTSTPTSVMSPGKRSIKVYCNWSNSAYFTVNDELYAMGNNGVGQLGTGDTTSHSSPTLIMTGVSKFDAGLYCAAAVVNGVVKTWGSAYALGVDSSTSQSNSPVTVTGISNCIIIEIGRKDFYAVCCDYNAYNQENDYVMAWGDNTSGQLGLGTTTIQYTPAVAGF